MSAICGIWHKDGKPALTSAIEDMVEALDHWEADRKATTVHSDVAMGHLLLQNTPESFLETQPLGDSMDKILLTANLRLDYRDELGSKLNIVVDEQISDPELLLRSYKKWGKKCVDHLFGDFAFAIYDATDDLIFCARDQLGVKSLVYYNGAELFAFASETKAIRVLDSVKTSIRNEWVLDYLAHIIPDNTSTAYDNIFKLPPAHHLTIQRNTDPVLESYWSLKDIEPVNYNSEEEWADALNKNMTAAVTERLRSSFPVGSELSSGVDSATITAIANKNVANLASFSNVMNDENMSRIPPFGDERDDIGKIVEHCALRDHHYLSGIDYPVSKLLSEVNDLFDAPPITFAGVFFDAIHRKAQENGIRVMLAGTGGDELVTTRGKGHMEELWSNGQYGKLMKAIKNEHPHRPLRKFAAFIVKRSKTIRKLVRDRKRKPLGYYRLQHVRKDQIDINNLKDRIARLKYFPEPESIRNYQELRLNNNAMVAGLEQVEILARKHRMEYRFPMLDVKLISLAYQMPNELKIKNGINRYLFRKVMSNYLPEEITWDTRKKRIFNTPSAYQRVLVDRDNLLEMINMSSLNSGVNRFIEMDKVIEIIRGFDEEFSSYPTMQVNGAMQTFFLASFLQE